MIAVIWEFLTSKVGRYILIVGTACAALVAALVKAFSAGKKVEQQKQTAKQLDAVEKAHEIHGDVARLPDDAARDELRRWGPR